MFNNNDDTASYTVCLTDDESDDRSYHYTFVYIPSCLSNKDQAR